MSSNLDTLPAGVFSLLLTFRSLDLALGASFVHGIKFMWHLLKGQKLELFALPVLPAKGAGNHCGRLR